MGQVRMEYAWRGSDKDQEGMPSSAVADADADADTDTLFRFW